MKSIERFEKIFLYQGRVDFRKQIDGLGAIITQELRQDLKENSLFIFCSKDKRKIKMVYFDRTGFALWYKRLEDERFKILFEENQVLNLGHQLLQLFLDGFDIFKQKPHKKSEFSRFL